MRWGTRKKVRVLWLSAYVAGERYRDEHCYVEGIFWLWYDFSCYVPLVHSVRSVLPVLHVLLFFLLEHITSVFQ